MDIKAGKYTLRSDSQCFWIEETRVTEKENGEAGSKRSRFRKVRVDRNELKEGK